MYTCGLTVVIKRICYVMLCYPFCLLPFPSVYLPSPVLSCGWVWHAACNVVARRCLNALLEICRQSGFFKTQSFVLDVRIVTYCSLFYVIPLMVRPAVYTTNAVHCGCFCAAVYNSCNVRATRMIFTRARVCVCVYVRYWWRDDVVRRCSRWAVQRGLGVSVRVTCPGSGRLWSAHSQLSLSTRLPARQRRLRR